jgi:hypothetical protein
MLCSLILFIIVAAENQMHSVASVQMIPNGNLYDIQWDLLVGF